MTAVSTHKDTYIYQDLDATRRQIRLIKVEKSGFLTSPPRCNMHVFDIASTPPYIALSYTWGPPDPSRRILVDNRTFEVRDNVYHFLCGFQSGSAVRTHIAYLYIDQICINQENLQEKNSQVLLMADIYMKSTLVVAWLGCDPVMVKAARDFETDMENCYKLNFSSSALRKLLTNSYFTRVWIVQEVSLARNISIVCGYVELQWSTVRLAVEKLDSLRSINGIGTVNDLFKEQDQRKMWRLDSIVKKYSGHKCQDPRDKVYGFLGMIPIAQRPVVDYSKSTHQVFLDLIPIVLDIYWKRRPTAPTHDVRFYGDFRVYLGNLLEIAWNMGFPDRDQRGLVGMFKQIVEEEEKLSWEPPGSSLTERISGFGYETIEPSVLGNGQGLLKRRWWMEVNGQKHYHDCRSAQHFDRAIAWRFLHRVQMRRPCPS